VHFLAAPMDDSAVVLRLTNPWLRVWFLLSTCVIHAKGVRLPRQSTRAGQTNGCASASLKVAKQRKTPGLKCVMKAVDECSADRQFKVRTGHETIQGSRMSTATFLVSELLRAANSAEKPSPNRVRDLLERAIAMVQDIRRRVGIIPIRERDSLTYLRTILTNAGRDSEEEWRNAFLHAAGMLRDLHIVADSGTEFRMMTD
jgi:hypothetical protein